MFNELLVSFIRFYYKCILITGILKIESYPTQAVYYIMLILHVLRYFLLIHFSFYQPKTTIYLSTIIPNPGPAFYEWKLTTSPETNAFEQVLIDVLSRTIGRRKRQAVSSVEYRLHNKSCTADILFL